MRFLYEKQTRKFYWFLLCLCILLICFLGACGIFQVWNVRKVLVGRELAVTSYLLDQRVPPAVIASAWNHTEVTEAGRELLRTIGHTEQTQSYLWLLLEQTSVPYFLLLLSGGIIFAGVFLTRTAVFFQHREQLYEEVEKVIACYADNQFEMHLPTGEAGTLYQMFGSIEQLAQSLQAKSEMEQKTKEFLKDMISNISHQLKTPLAACSMYMEIILGEPEKEEVVRNFARKSVQSLERMEQLIQSLLKMARLDTGNILFEKRQCVIAELVEQAAYDLLERAGREGKVIRIEGRVDEIWRCDPEWTKEAVGNLVKNALDHTVEGGVIRISWEKSSAVFRLSVEDNGCGIAEEEMHHIFKRFYRSQTSNDRQGCGLGLSLAKSIIEGQGGNLSVKSNPGEGSVFYMTFLADL